MCRIIETKFLSLCVCSSIVSWHILESSMFISWCQVWPGFNLCFCLIFQVYEQPVLLLLMWWPVMTLILPTLSESCDVTTLFMFLRPPCIIISGNFRRNWHHMFAGCVWNLCSDLVTSPILNLMDFRSRLLVKLLFGYIFLTVDVYKCHCFPRSYSFLILFPVSTDNLKMVNVMWSLLLSGLSPWTV